MIQLEEVSKRFPISRRRRRELGLDGRPSGRWLTAVDRVSFQCRPGRVTGLIGPNGAGKTTLLRMIATLLRPSNGRIRVAGFDAVREAREVRRRIGFLTGKTGLYDRLTPEEMIRYQADLYEMPPREFRQRRDRLYALLGMEEFAQRRISQLSSGMRQKVSIVRTIIHDPEVVVFDEPTTGLDVMTSRGIIQLIRSCREEGKTVLFSTHVMSEVKLLCDDVAIIHRGRLYYWGSLAQFEEQMTHSTFEDEFIHLVGEA